MQPAEDKRESNDTPLNDPWSKDHKADPYPLIRDVQGILLESQMLHKKLKRHVYELSHNIGIRSIFSSANYRHAEAYIANTFNSYGFDVKFQEYELV